MRRRILATLRNGALVLALGFGLAAPVYAVDGVIEINPSLENLKNTFDQIKAELRGKSGENEIMYRQGDDGSIDVQTVLQYMALFDLDRYPDRKAYPHRIFGHAKLALKQFTDRKNRDEDSDAGPDVFDRVLPKLYEVLVLADKIQMGLAKSLGQLKISGAKRDNRVGSPRYKNLPAHFAGGPIGGKIPLAWLFPALASLRANVDPDAWKTGRLEWRMEPAPLIDEVMEEWAGILLQEHQDNRGKIADVGRKESAYRGCYSVVTVVLAEQGYLG